MALAIAMAALRQPSRRASVTALVGAASAAGLLAGSDLVMRVGGTMDHWTLSAIALMQGAGFLAVARPRKGVIPAAREFGSAVAASTGIGLLTLALAVTELGHGPLAILVLYGPSCRTRCCPASFWAARRFCLPARSAPGRFGMRTVAGWSWRASRRRRARGQP